MAAVSLLMIIAPLGSGVHPATAISPPYTGATVSPSTYWSYSGCALAKVIAYAKWSPTSGAGVFGASASARSACRALGSVGGGGYASVSGDWYVQIPLTVPSGTTSVQPNWTVAYTAAEKLVVAKPCPKFVPPPSGYAYHSCSAYSYLSFNLYEYVIDTTSNSYLGSAYLSAYNYSNQYNSTNCYNGNCTFYNSSYGGPASLSVNMPWIGYINSTYNSSHSFTLYISFSAYMDGSTYGYLSSVSTAVFNMHNGATFTKLNSIGIV